MAWTLPEILAAVGHTPSQGVLFPSGTASCKGICMSIVKLVCGLMVRTLFAITARSSLGAEHQVPAHSWGTLEEQKVEDISTWLIWFGDAAIVSTESELQDRSRFELRDGIAAPVWNGENFAVAMESKLELDTSDWPLQIHGSGSAEADGSGLIAKFELPTGSVGDDESGQRQVAWGRHVLACIEVCKGVKTGALELMEKGSVNKAVSAIGNVEISGQAIKAAPLHGLGESSLETRRTVFRLQWFLRKIGGESLLKSLELDVQSDTEFGLYLKDAGIGIDVGYEVKSQSITGPGFKPGFRVYTMQVAPGSRFHPPEDYDHTELETLSMDEALLCVGTLLSQLALNYIPDLPEELKYPETVLED